MSRKSCDPITLVTTCHDALLNTRTTSTSPLDAPSSTTHAAPPPPLSASEPTSSSPSPSPSRIAAAARNPALDLAQYGCEPPSSRLLCATSSPRAAPSMRLGIVPASHGTCAPFAPPSSRVPSTYPPFTTPPRPHRTLLSAEEPTICAPSGQRPTSGGNAPAAGQRPTPPDTIDTPGYAPRDRKPPNERQPPPLRKHAQSPSLHLARRRRRSQRHPPPLPTKSRRRPFKRLRRKRAIPRRRANSFRGDGAQLRTAAPAIERRGRQAETGQGEREAAARQESARPFPRARIRGAPPSPVRGPLAHLCSARQPPRPRL
ncbi:hypothetical protein B0H15DRAFT_953057 [Mycena belliarum]|uniref:Uncharacterized protein n=1 Tax=Mycena belliarum TaxID=1033014 RepID=A0AAD6U183_9AGAR|nr:hypothetical protein B0H15DRAFT_953057 [Mycena belliae]